MEKIKKKLNSKSVAGYVFTAPLIFGFLFFLLVPMIISIIRFAIIIFCHRQSSADWPIIKR